MHKKYIKLISYIEIVIGVICLDIAYYFFLQPTSLVTGGIMGISIMVEDFLPFSPSIFMYICNISLLILGLFTLGKDFFIKTCFTSIFSPTVILIFENTLETDLFLRSINQNNWYFASMIIAGIFTAIGLGLCFRRNATTGGIDIIQKIMTKYMHIPYSKTMYLTDWVIIILSGFFVSETYIYNVESVLYGSLSVLLVGYLVDYIALNGKSKRTAYIITSKPNEMKQMIYDQISRGVTECDVRGGYTGNNRTMLICTLDKLEAYKIQNFIHIVDPESFTFMNQTKEVVGDYE